MKYYTINRSDDIKTIGYYPQTELASHYNPRLANSHWNVYHTEFPNFTPEYELELNSNAYPTSYLHAYDNKFGMVVDAKFKEVLKRSKLPSHRFYPIKVYQKGKLLEYYWFHYVLDLWSYVDIENSKAQIFKKFEFEVEKIIPIPNLESIKDFKKSLDRKQLLQLRELRLKKDFPKYDIIEVTKVEYSGNLLSDRLVTSLKEAGLTGFEIKPYDKIITE